MHKEDLDKSKNFGTGERTATKPLRTATRAFCFSCRKSVRLVEFAEASNYLKTSFAELLVLANRRQLHRLHNADAVVMICSDSLARYFENRTTGRLRIERISDDLHLTR